MLEDSVMKVNEKRTFPIMIVNETNKTFRLRRGCVVGKAEQVPSESVIEINHQPSEVSEVSESKPNFLTDAVIPLEHRSKLVPLLEKNADIFAQKDTELGETDTVQMTIDTGDHPPIKLRPYRAPINTRKKIEQAVDEMLEAKIIEKSDSPWSFPCILVDKPDGTKRFCVDFRQLNKITKSYAYPLPLIDDILAQLGGSKCFSVVDMKAGFWQIKMATPDKQKTAFACHKGLFHFNRLCFGLAGAPSRFQQLMGIVLGPCSEFAIPYIDDIIIFSPNVEKHLEHLQAVFDCLRQHNLKLKLKKCSFLQETTHYLGFSLTPNGISITEDRTKAIRSMTAPTSVREVRAFLGTIGYYRRMIPNFSGIAEPLLKLTKKYARFNWNDECQKSFDYLKDSLTAVPLLGYPDPEKNFYILYTDASDYCVGAVLVQPCDDQEKYIPGVPNEKPIYFLSHKLSDTQRRWSTIEKELFGITYALNKLNFFLQGAKFIIKTDHKPLTYILDSPNLCPKFQRIALEISAYDCRIEHIAGKANNCADLLSRMYHKGPETDSGPPERESNDHALEVGYINTNRVGIKTFDSAELPPEKPLVKPVLENFSMLQEQQNDEELMAIKRQIESNKAPKTLYTRYMIIDDLLYYISNADEEPQLRLCIPGNLQDYVLSQHHDELGHMGIDKVYDRIRLKYYWPNLYKNVYDYVSRCLTCQQHSMKAEKAPVQIPDIPPYPWAKVALDVSGPHQLSASGNRYIVTFICLYSGFPEAFPTKDKSAETIASLLINEIFPRYSCPISLMMDNGSENCNRIMDETLKELNVTGIHISPYTPRVNGMVERNHKTLNSILAKYLDDHLGQWDIHLNQALAAIRFSISESSKFSPFALLYNRDPTLPIDNLLKPRRKYLGEEHHIIALERAHEFFTKVQRNLRKAKKRQADHANAKVRDDQELEIGEPVFLKKFRRPNKHASRWIPYYRVVGKTGPVNYQIRSHLDGRIIDAHRTGIKPANIDEWYPPKDENERVLRKAAYVVPTSDSSSDESGEPDHTPRKRQRLQKKAKKRVNTRRHSSSVSSESDDPDDDIPLRELQKRLRMQKSQKDHENTEVTPEVSSEPMEIDSILPPVGPKSRSSVESDRSVKLKMLFKTVADLL